MLAVGIFSLPLPAQGLLETTLHILGTIHLPVKKRFVMDVHIEGISTTILGLHCSSKIPPLRQVYRYDFPYDLWRVVSEFPDEAVDYSINVRLELYGDAFGIILGHQLYTSIFQPILLNSNLHLPLH